jgi:hypothetical protein
MDTANQDMSNPTYRKVLERQQALEGSYPELVVAPLARPAAVAAGKVADGTKALFQTVERPEWPTVYNHVVGAETVVPAVTKANILKGRPFTTEDKVTYGYRNLSEAELADLQKTGYLNPNPAAAFSKDGKWFSAGDETGTFGRVWKNAPTNSTIRVPIEEIPKTKAVSAKNVQLLDKETGKYKDFLNPPTSEKMVDLYRAEGVPYTGNSWSRQAYLESPAAKAAGRWYTDDVSALKFYADNVGENVVIKHIRAPLSEVEKYRVSNLPKVSHKGSDVIDPRSYSRDPKVEFFLPEELAKKGKKVNK